MVCRINGLTGPEPSKRTFNQRQQQRHVINRSADYREVDQPARPQALQPCNSVGITDSGRSPQPPSLLLPTRRLTSSSPILGQDLPPVLLTVYDETNFEDNENGKKRVHDYAIQMVQKQSRQLMNFCSCEFVVVPCTIEKRILTPEILENEVDKQKQKTRSYYRGPHRLSEETYTKLKEAMTVLLAGSYVPCFLDEYKNVTDTVKTKSQFFLKDQRVYVCRPKPVREYVVCECACVCGAVGVGGGGGGACVRACVRAFTTRFTVVSFAVIDLSNTRYGLF